MPESTELHSTYQIRFSVERFTKHFLCALYPHVTYAIKYGWMDGTLSVSMEENDERLAARDRGGSEFGTDVPAIGSIASGNPSSSCCRQPRVGGFRTEKDR